MQHSADCCNVEVPDDESHYKKLLLAVKKEVGGHGANTDGFICTHVSVAATVVVY